MLLTHAFSIVLALASFQASEPLMWTGKMLVGTRKEPSKDSANQYAGELRRQLDELRTRTELKRDFADQLGEIDTLRALASWWPEYAGKAEIAVGIATTRADWLEKLGRHDEAVFAARHPYVMFEELNNKPYNEFVMVPSDGKLAELVQRTEALPAMVELRKRFALGAQSAPGGDAIEEVVRRTIENGDPISLRDFGTRCVPALRKALEESRSDETRFNIVSDPLTVLLGIDRKAGEELILATLGRRGPAWTLRAVRSLAQCGVTMESWVNSPDPLSPPSFDDPLTLQVIDALAAQPMSAPAYFQLLNLLVCNEVISPAVEAYLKTQTHATDPVIVSLLSTMLDGTRCGPRKRPLYEAFLDSSNPDLRRRSATALAHYPVGPATLRAVQHADPVVRSTALVALVRHWVTPPRYSGSTAAEKREMKVERTSEIEAALVRLAKDSDRAVRRELAKALSDAREDPPASVLETLLADSDWEVRSAAAADWSFHPELQAHVLEVLANDKDAQVLRTVGFALNRRSPSRNGAARDAEFQHYLPALLRWLNNPATKLESDPNCGPNAPLLGALRTPEGAKVVFEGCVRGPNRDTLAPVLFGALIWPRMQQAGKSIIETLPAENIAEIFALVLTVQPERRGDGMQESLLAAVTDGTLDAKPFIVLGRDEKQSRTVRLRALSVAAPRGGADFRDALLDFLRSPTPAELEWAQPAGKEFVNWLNQVLRTWPERAEMRSPILLDATIPDSLALYVAATISGAPLPDAAATHAALQRWSRLDDVWKNRDDGILYRLDPALEPGLIEVWRTSYRVPALSEAVVGAMGRFPREESVPLLTECIRGEWLNGNDVDYVRSEAIRALTMRLDELGTDALLKAISSAHNDEIRKKCFDGLEQIRRYQDEKLSWQKRKGGEAARDQAINDLLPMLADKDAGTRAAAARSLATLQAVEHLPKLVALLKDKDAGVREAAQKALDALNSVPAKKP